MNLRAETIRARTKIWLAHWRFNHALTASGATPAIEESAKTKGGTASITRPAEEKGEPSNEVAFETMRR